MFQKSSTGQRPEKKRNIFEKLSSSLQKKNLKINFFPPNICLTALSLPHGKLN